ncbi:MAG: aromatic hydrocarbon degradation protein [Chitinophagaceae bacterium]|nr:aromatic hydrocarbon degradation protein [Chitinophagaceae bacterium]
MKKIPLLLFSYLTAYTVFAQEPADALRYSWLVPGGTARQQAIGGAMGSLGGDISATFVNPAGLAFYKTGDFVLSPAYRFGKNKSTYLNRTDRESDKNFLLGTSGFVIGSGRQGRGFNNVAFSLAFNHTGDFNSDILYRGFNNQSSYSQKFLEEINNQNLKDANQVAQDFPLGTSLAFNTYWIDTIAGGSSGNYQFQSRAANILSTGLLQQQTIKNRGGVNEFALGGAINFNDKLMIGGTLGIPLLKYERDATFIEADATENTDNKFNSASFTENLETTGVGVNLRAGLIYKPQEYWRLGLAIHSPTFYSLTDKYNYTVETDTEGYQGVQKQSTQDITGTGSEFKYMLFTPYKVIGSISYVIREIQDVTKQKGFLTADVEYVNYKASTFEADEENGTDQSTEDYFSSLNKAIDNAYKSALNFRVGGELKFTTIMVRAGAAYYGNPYQNINGEKGRKLNLSGGLGYRNKGMFVDLTYVHAMNKDVHFPYRLQSSPYFGANVKSTVGNIFLTLGTKF